MRKDVSWKSTAPDPGVSRKNIEPLPRGARVKGSEARTTDAPPIPEHRRLVYEYYRLDFDEEGCPMKRTDSGLIFHPILAAYLVVDYMTWFKKTRNTLYLDYAIRIAGLALKRCALFENAAVFFYRQGDGLSYVPGEYYSALTQAWYIKALSVLRPYSIKRVKYGYEKELKALYNSLLIPIEEGGVLIIKDYGWIVEEYPHAPPLYTLNGWLTVLRIIKDSQLILSEIGVEVDDFLANNFRAVEKVLPLYDAEFVYNSRYQLTGFTRVKLVFDKPVNYKVHEFAISIAGEGIFRGALEPAKTRWENYLERKESRILQFNVVLSLISHPLPNEFNLLLGIDRDCRVELLIADGDYSPSSTAMPTTRWRRVKSWGINAGEVSIQEQLPFDERNMFAYPTNFKKVIGGTRFNAYHFIHIIDLAEIYSYSGMPIFKEYALRWLKYIEAWQGVLELQDGKVSLKPHSYGDAFPTLVAKALARNAVITPFPMEM